MTAPGLEVLAALPQVDALVAGIGTGGTITGVGRRLKERNPRTIIVGVEPQFGERLQGLRSLEEGYIPPLLDFSLLDRRFMVDSASAFEAVRRLVEAEGHLRRHLRRSGLPCRPPRRRRTWSPVTWSWSSPTQGGST